MYYMTAANFVSQLHLFRILFVLRTVFQPLIVSLEVSIFTGLITLSIFEILNQIILLIFETEVYFEMFALLKIILHTN